MIVDKLERWTLEFDRYEVVMLRSILASQKAEMEQGMIYLDAEEIAFIEQLENNLGELK